MAAERQASADEGEQQEPVGAEEARARQVRRLVYLIVVGVALGQVAGRIAAVNSVDYARLDQRLQKENPERPSIQRPFLSSNDRSRWATVRALVEEGTYAIDEIVSQPGWDTIDMVKHDEELRGGLGPDEGKLYSSKPPLLPTLMAAEYWVIHKVTGDTLGTHPYSIGRFMLITINGLGLAVYLAVMAGLAERLGATDFGRVFVVASAAFGTFLTTFAVVINNHLIAAISAAIALGCSVRIWYGGERRWWLFFAAGLFGAFAAANELPALALLGMLGLAVLVKSPRQTFAAFLPGVVIVAAGFFGTNYAAHGTIKPAYLFRHPDEPESNWYDYEYRRGERVIESYWNDPDGIDAGEDHPGTYALHALVGHHGILSLTPIWLLTLIGWGISFAGPKRRWWELAAMVVVVTAVCLAFYLTRSQIYRNYGGMTSGFRWMFWFAPLWLATMLPAADKFACCLAGRITAVALLLFSAMSASYPTWNPWTHPWLLNLLQWLEWYELPGG